MSEDGIRQVSEEIKFVTVKGAEDILDDLYPLVDKDTNLVLFDVPCEFEKGGWVPYWTPDLPKESYVKGTHIQTNFPSKKTNKLKRVARRLLDAVVKDKSIKPEWLKFGHRIWFRYAIKDCPHKVMDEVMANVEIKHGEKATAIFIWNNTMNAKRKKWSELNKPKKDEE